MPRVRRPWRMACGLSLFSALSALAIAAPWLVDLSGPWCLEHPRMTTWLPFGSQCLRAGEALTWPRGNASGVTVHPGSWRVLGRPEENGSHWHDTTDR